MSWPVPVAVGQDFVFFPDDKMAATIVTDIGVMKLDVVSEPRWRLHCPDKQKIMTSLGSWGIEDKRENLKRLYDGAATFNNNY
jgi:hypothetical protein